MCRGKNMNVMVMDVEGTDGRERGEDQVRIPLVAFVGALLIMHRTLSENLPSSLWPRPRSSSSTYGNIKSDYIRGLTWVSSRQSSK